MDKKDYIFLISDLLTLKLAAFLTTRGDTENAKFLLDGLKDERVWRGDK